MKKAWLGALMVVLSAAAGVEAATWCVPNNTIRSVCPNVSLLLQSAIDQANVGDIIYVGAGNVPERITIPKRLTIRGLPGHLITDAGLVPGDNLITFTGTYNTPKLEFLKLDVVTSQVGIFIPETINYTSMKQVQVVSTQVPKPFAGVIASRTLRTGFHGLKDAPESVQGIVSGFQIGMVMDDVSFANIEPALIMNNDVGVYFTKGGYQIFYVEFRNNGVGLSVCGLYHIDINSNVFRGNGLALEWGRCFNPDTNTDVQKLVEFNHNVFEGNTENVSIEVLPGVFSSSHLDDPGCFVQWRNMTFDGILQQEVVKSC